jgi:S1-C subfamily serine protease
MLFAVRSKQQKAGIIAAVVTLSITCIFLFLLWSQKERISGVSSQVATVARQVEDMSANDAAQIFKKYGAAVHFVVWEGVNSGGRNYSACGTAFAINASGRFATNAHVARPVAEECLKKGKTAVLVSQEGQKYPVTASRYHPHYSEGRGHTPDVGVLTANVPAGAPVIVEVATDTELRQLEVGSPLCYIGFPVFQESDYDSLKKVNARVYQGRLNRLLTLAEERGEFGVQQLLEHDMFSWGGASGSPIFDKRGKVVALHFAGNLVDGKRSPASPKWGIRVDLLREVMATE